MTDTDTQIVLQCLGPFCALLLSEPGKVIRPNGARVLMENKSSVLSELKATYHRVFKRWDVLLLVPVMLYVSCCHPFAHVGPKLILSTLFLCQVTWFSS